MAEKDWDQAVITAVAENLSLGQALFLASTSSTNDLAARLAAEDAPDLSLVVADQQTAGKGRVGRKWFSPPGASVSFSLLLKNLAEISEYQNANDLLLRYTALGALAVCDAIAELFQIAAEIKWPNDVLVEGRKVCGVLAEAHWLGNQLEAIVLGVGINVSPQAIPSDSELLFPASCIQNHVDGDISRSLLLAQVISKILYWRSHLQSPTFLQSWENRLAFRGQQVTIFWNSLDTASPMVTGKITGLDALGRLVLEDQRGKVESIRFGELRLRPL